MKSLYFHCDEITFHFYVPWQCKTCILGPSLLTYNYKLIDEIDAHFLFPPRGRICLSCNNFLAYSGSGLQNKHVVVVICLFISAEWSLITLQQT